MPRKIPEKTVNRIEKMLAAGHRHADIAEKTGVSVSSVSRVSATTVTMKRGAEKPAGIKPVEVNTNQQVMVLLRKARKDMVQLIAAGKIDRLDSAHLHTLLALDILENG